MLIKLTEEQRNNILGLIARAPKLPNESLLDLSRVTAGIEMALLNPIPEPGMSNKVLEKLELVPLENAQENPNPDNGKP